MGGRIVSDADRRIAERVKAARIAAGVSQTQLGDALGISFQQIQKYEAGANRWSGGMLQGAALRIGVPVAGFFNAASEAA
ncbi:helix-turn-helix transcriptional regulator [Methylobacterium sp. OT2]|uniref:helix-turn-helix domain-containing protein n=1 Tax=Methylobacterium sp. OT2 TaxID=2813779 RepID=UPI00197C8A94|nr:helix-turn-helix transcriptional regulator [Methylobacterium sp. OT2]MBN4095608.1 helix-turn-helix transcriptional regulator [Methylobacterium sp. OT2]